MNSRVDDLVRRRAEDEDEIMLFVLPAVYLLSSKMKRLKLLTCSRMHKTGRSS
jgi:hypothetical protein